MFKEHKNKVRMSYDIETTGLDHTKDKIIEIGAVKIYPDGSKKEFSELININKKLPKIIIDITKITDNMLKKDGKEPNAVYESFAKFCEDVDIIIGQNIIEFDNRFIDRVIPDLLLHKEVFDTKLYARHNLEVAKTSLASLVLHYNLEFDGQHHRALDDAKTTYMIYENMMRGERLND